MAAAVELWQVRPIGEAEREAALRTARSYLSSEVLARRRADKSRNYFAIHHALFERLARRAADQRTRLDEGTVRCLARGLAYSLTVEQLRDLRRFVQSPSGGAFWDYYSGGRDLMECLKDQLQQIAAPFIEADAAEAMRSR